MRLLNTALLESIKAYIIEHQKEHGTAPSYRAIMRAMKMSSLNLVQRYVLELEKNGDIKRTDLGNIAVLPQLKRTGTTVAPLVGDIACGLPTDSVENIEETYTLPKALFGNGDLFLLRTFGDSMIDIGIEKDDLVVIRKQDYASPGDIVVALADGCTTLKRYLLHKGKVVLHPENAAMKDIRPRECMIQGVLVSCIKMY